MVLPVNSQYQTNFSSVGDRYVFAVDNNGRPFIVDTQTETRFATGPPGTGSYKAAQQMFGNPLAGVYLTGFTEKKAIGDLFEPNQMEKILSGQAPVPAEMRGQFDVNENGFVTNPTTIRAGSGQVFEAVQTTQAQPDNADVQRSAKARIREVLGEFDLGSLTDHVWGQVQEWGASLTDSLIMQEIRQTKEYKKRFAGLELRNKNNFDPISEREYVQMEKQYEAIMAYFDLPERFYDQASDFANLIGNNVSAAELESRVTDGYMAALNAPVEVKSALARYYGVPVDKVNGALASYFLDPEKGLNAIQQEFAAAQVAGASDMTGFGRLDQATAERLGGLGIGFGQAAQGFAELGAQRHLFSETITEGRDLDIEEEGIRAQFEGDIDAAEALRRRVEERRARFGGSGGAAQSQRGVVGLGSAS